MRRGLHILFPLVLGLALLALWQLLVRHYAVPVYVLPAPSDIAAAFTANFASLMAALANTFLVTLEGFAGALVAALLLAVLFSQSRLLEQALYPYAVVLQVTPVVAIAPLILIWVGFEHINLALSLIVGIVTLFPILSNAVAGLKATDRNLIDLGRLYRASRWQLLWRIRFPAALPQLLTGMKIGGVLALIGEVTAEFSAGSGTASGLAWRIVESGNRLEIATLFAALALLALLGIAIFAGLSALEYALLRSWHDSAREKQ